MYEDEADWFAMMQDDGLFAIERTLTNLVMKIDALFAIQQPSQIFSQPQWQPTEEQELELAQCLEDPFKAGPIDLDNDFCQDDPSEDMLAPSFSEISVSSSLHQSIDVQVKCTSEFGFRRISVSRVII